MKQTRQKSALRRLEAQLKAGVKTVKGDLGEVVTAPLEEKDVKRIRKEIEILKRKIA